MKKFCPICLEEGKKEGKKTKIKINQIRLKKSFSFPLRRLIYSCPRCGRKYISTKKTNFLDNIYFVKKGYSLASPLVSGELKEKFFLLIKLEEA